jgi:hypothetical protein
MIETPQLGLCRLNRHPAIVLLIVLVASLIVYKKEPALDAIRAAKSSGWLMPRPYLTSSILSAKPEVVWAESLAYVRIIWPALLFGILIAAAAYGRHSARLVRVVDGGTEQV